MKYLFIFSILLTGCSPDVELSSNSPINIEMCTKECKNKFGEKTTCDFVGPLTGTYYCK